MSDNLTALERELLKSVESFMTGTKAELAALQDGLRVYDTNVQESSNARLKRVEDRMTAIEQSLESVLVPLTRRLEAYQEQTEQLNRLLNKLNQL